MPTAEKLATDLPEDPKGWAMRWAAEIPAAREVIKKWWESAEEAVRAYTDERDGEKKGESHLNLYHSNTANMEALLFGKTPQVDVDRRFADSSDDQARVAAEMMERLLNTDLEKESDNQQEAFRNALKDRLTPALGNVFLRFEAKFEDQAETPAIMRNGAQAAPPVAAQQVKVPGSEKVHVDYKHWKDQLWSPCKTFDQLRWWAFGNDMSETDFVKRFGEEKRASFTANKKRNEGQKDDDYKDPLARCYVWEIWSKERHTVDWFIEGADETLDHKDDPLGLEGFWPFPRPMMANLTTSHLIPTTDWHLAKDLYESIDELETRCDMLQSAIRVVGVYNKANHGVQRMLSPKRRNNELIPIDDWAVFAESGGVKGQIDWLPLEMVVAALAELREVENEKIAKVYQVTGMSDIMRGQAAQQATATEQAIKARFASVRVQSLQDEFARFCSDTQRIKAEIISKMFDPQTIIDRSNIMRTPDAQLAPQAAQLIKDRFYEYRISVNPDSVALQDYAALKSERTEFAQSISTYFQGMIPLIQMLGAVPGAVPVAVQFTLELGQSLLAGMKGASEMEGIFDQFIAQLKQIAAQPPPPPQPDPQLQVAQVKAGAEQFKAKAGMAQTGMDMQVAQAEHEMKMREMHAGILSEEAKARSGAVQAVNKVTAEGPT